MNDRRVEILSYTYEPLYTTSWQEAVGDIFSGRAEVVEEHEHLRIGVMDGNFLSSIALPKVVRFKTGIPPGKILLRKKLKFNRNDLFHRDNGKCQYCDIHLTKDVATIDHVLPVSKGGTTTWDNCVLCCKSCNSKKGNKLLSETHMFLRVQPKEPKYSMQLAQTKKDN